MRGRHRSVSWPSRHTRLVSLPSTYFFEVVEGAVILVLQQLQPVDGGVFRFVSAAVRCNGAGPHGLRSTDVPGLLRAETQYDRTAVTRASVRSKSKTNENIAITR